MTTVFGKCKVKRVLMRLLAGMPELKERMIMEKVNCVVVGAGPAGAACALSLARKGIETVLLERGTRAGEKNVASSVLFTPVLEKIIPEFRDDFFQDGSKQNR